MMSVLLVEMARGMLGRIDLGSGYASLEVFALYIHHVQSIHALWNSSISYADFETIFSPKI